MLSTSFSSSFRVLGFKLSSLIKVFLLVQNERYMSNLILLHVDTQSFLSDLFTILSFLWRFWQCCQKNRGLPSRYSPPLIYSLTYANDISFVLLSFFVYMYTFVHAFTCMWEYMAVCAHLYICIWKFKLMSKIILDFSSNFWGSVSQSNQEFLVMTSLVLGLGL